MDLGVGGNTLGVVAPAAAETTPFKENGGANTGAIFSTHALDFKNRGFGTLVRHN